MKSLFLGIVAIILIGIGGLVYRNAVERVAQPVACPVLALRCPDGTSVAHLSNSCDFPACPLPNVSLADAQIAFAIPDGFFVGELVDDASVATYVGPQASTSASTIIIRRFAVNASSTALATIRQTAISGTSGESVPVTAFSSVSLGRNNFTVVSIERFEGVVDTAYYLARSSDVLRFDAIDQGVTNWTDPNLDTTRLPANAALRKLLTTLQ